MCWSILFVNLKHVKYEIMHAFWKLRKAMSILWEWSVNDYVLLWTDWKTILMNSLNINVIGFLTIVRILLLKGVSELI